jgi:hypothetical protein
VVFRFGGIFEMYACGGILGAYWFGGILDVYQLVVFWAPPKLNITLFLY